jgi:hypothetical protein
LQTIYGLEDLYTFLEIMAVDGANRRTMMENTKNK